MANDDKTTQLAYSQERGEASVQSQPSHEDQTKYRQAKAYVKSNPNAAGAANKYKVYQKVQVYRSGDGWVTGTVNKYKSDGVGSWLYKLVDGKGREIWVDQPTWFSEAQLDRFSRGEKY